MSDIVDLTDSALSPDANSPYGQGPFRFDGALFLLQKRGRIYFATFTTLRPPFKGQQWTATASLAKRFDDSRHAGEVSRFLETLPDAKQYGEVALIVRVQEPNQMPKRAPRLLVDVPDENMSAKQWLTTYTGVTGKRL